MNHKSVYLDYSAATPMDPSVLQQILPYFSKEFYNPSASYLSAKRVSKDITEARSTVAMVLGSRPSEIVFTAGGTEANNLAISGVMDHYPGSEVIVSAIEHESILEPAKKYKMSLVPVSKDGVVDLLKLKSQITPRTVLISIMYANNEIGTIQPLKHIAGLINEVRLERQRSKNKQPLYFHTDACQAPVYLDIHVSRLGVDLMTLNGGKIYGPKQSGVLYISRHVKLNPQILGGGQESGVRSGTENVANIIGFSEALKIAQSRAPQENSRVRKLQEQFYQALAEQIPQSQVNGTMKKRLPNNLNVTFAGQDNETMLMKLDELGIMCAAGSACNARSNTASHVLRAIGLSEKQARESLRFSLGNQTKSTDIDYVMNALVRIL